MKYRDNFDHLGCPVDKEVPLRLVDLVSIVFLIGVVSAMFAGVFQ